MRRLIRIELALAVCILAVVAVWRFTPPPRALMLAAVAKPTFVHLHTAAAMAEVTVIPPQGQTPAQMQLVLMNDHLIPLDPKEVTVYFSNAAAGIEPIRREARRSADGIWHIDRLDLPPAPQWTIRIDALVSDFSRVSLQGQVAIKPLRP